MIIIDILLSCDLAHYLQLLLMFVDHFHNCIFNEVFAVFMFFHRNKFYGAKVTFPTQQLVSNQQALNPNMSASCFCRATSLTPETEISR